jgi:ribosomal protein S18 acetylase RimI-like enzyme
MDWGLAEEDFRFMIDLEPHGCFVAKENSKVVGLATTISFGEVGWIGNVIIERDRRDRGYGSLLVRHAMDYLKGVGTQTIGLYAYLRAVPLYERLGFKSDVVFEVLEGRPLSPPCGRDVRKADEKDLDDIFDLDICCFGGSRKRLLERIALKKGNLCYVGWRGDKLLGFVFAKRYSEMAEVGPLVCRIGYEQVSTDLLYAIMGDLTDLKVRICVTKNAELFVPTLKNWGFNELFQVVRMFYGKPVIDRGCLVVAESLERG